MRKKVLMLVLKMLDLKNPSEVAIAMYMTKTYDEVHSRRAADEFLLHWADIELVESMGKAQCHALREMTAAEERQAADDDTTEASPEAIGIAGD
eukprot:CAMPEP_0174726114 /NCGR_PEP_ID=MMETSP1094-20130205/47068_1 /TAXON_ID=156173 /ORGANISM="Chrysochromulina brevifilum, Strain UTEX LB 985" /LENGTH=93 /DNA_ID=CAMNT_0015927633 /DNA_START=366 /DNA_END=645 /DNA_ORIENTATION=-